MFKTVPRPILAGPVAVVVAGAIALTTAVLHSSDEDPHDRAPTASQATSAAPAQPTDGQAAAPGATNDKEVDAVAAEVSRLAPDTFAGLTVNASRGTVDAYWVGAPPQAVIVYATTRPHDVTVTLHDDAQFSRLQLTSAANRLAQSSLGKQIGVASVSANTDGSGLQVDLNGPRPSADEADQVEQLTGLPGSAIKYVPDNAIVLR